jgi:hypothetical protein
MDEEIAGTGGIAGGEIRIQGYVIFHMAYEIWHMAH